MPPLEMCQEAALDAAPPISPVGRWASHSIGARPDGQRGAENEAQHERAHYDDHLHHLKLPRRPETTTASPLTFSSLNAAHADEVSTARKVSLGSRASRDRLRLRETGGNSLAGQKPRNVTTAPR